MTNTREYIYWLTIMWVIWGRMGQLVTLVFRVEGNGDGFGYGSPDSRLLILSNASVDPPVVFRTLTVTSLTVTLTQYFCLTLRVTMMMHHHTKVWWHTLLWFARHLPGKNKTALRTTNGLLVGP